MTIVNPLDGQNDPLNGRNYLFPDVTRMTLLKARMTLPMASDPVNGQNRVRMTLSMPRMTLSMTMLVSKAVSVN